MENLIKKNLLSKDQELQFKTISCITKHLQSLKMKHQRYAYLNLLIDWDIAWMLCDFLAVNNSEILRSTLVCLNIISESKLFYEKNIAMQAIMQILKNGFIISQKSTEERKILRMMALTLTVIVARANNFEIHLNSICEINEMLEFINNLNVVNSTNPTDILAASNLYSSVLLHMENVDNKKTLFLIINLYHNILMKMSEIVQSCVKNNNLLFCSAMMTIVAISNTGTMLCDNYSERFENNSKCILNHSESHGVNYFMPLIEITYNTMLEIIIPNVKIANAIDNETSIEIILCFTNCLCQLYKRQDININKISLQLLIQGYLKYLHEIIYQYENELCRKTICDCIASILLDLTKDNFAMDKWTNGPQGFRRYIKAGLLSHVKCEKMDVSTSSTDAFLFCYYFQYLATRDSEIVNIIKTIPLSVKIMRFSIDNIPEIPIFQVTFIWFAISILENPSEVIDENFYSALKRIIQIFEKVGVENCFVYHPALPCFILQNSIFPQTIRDSVVKLWLKSENNVHQLVSPGRKQNLIDCLLNIIQTGTGDLVKRASEELLQMISDNHNSTPLIEQQIVHMWEKLPEVLSNFISDCDGGIEGYLKILNRLSTTEVSVFLAIRCSHSLITTLDQKNLILSIDVKTLIVKQMSRMISVALAFEDGRVVSMYINNYKILDLLCVQGFSKEHDNLSAASFECLSNILHSQKRFSIECKKPVLLYPMDFFNVLLRKAHVYFDIMKFLNEIWLSKIEYLAVLRPVYTESEAKEILTGIYRTYIRIHLNASPSQWEFTFDCLINLLKFFRQYYNVVLFDCCDYLCNHSVVTMTISCNYFNSRFFEFVNTWLNLGLYIRCSFMTYALQSKCQRDAGKSVEIYFQTTFDDALQELNKYIIKLIAKGQLQANDVKELTSTLALFI